MKLVLSWLSLVTLGLAVGCSGASSDVEADDDLATQEDGLHSRFVGAYVGDATGTPEIEGLVLKSDGTFFAQIDKGLRCVRAPCPSHERLEGRYTVGTRYLTLKPATPTAPQSVFHARYAYRRTGTTLTLTHPQGWAENLSKEVSYCQSPTDCRGQSMIIPACMGQWRCESNRCAYDCSTSQSEIWPSNATKLVARMTGGFMPPPPPGSNCNGTQEYTFDATASELSWSRCDYRGPSVPRTLVTGSRTITAAERRKLENELGKVELSSQTIRGADKPYMTLTVTTPQKTTKYMDDFYSCHGSGPFVENIEAAFTALRELSL